MADLTTGTYLTTDPFFSLLQNVQDVKEKVAESVFEGYKLQVAQTNDINNRAMQVALHNTSALADLKQAVSKGTIETMLAAARTDAALGQTAMATQRLVMEEGERTRALINGLNTENLNTALINTNVSYSGVQGQYADLGLAYGGVCSAGVGVAQFADTIDAINATKSAVSGQRFVNTGVSTGTVQTSTPTQIG